MDGSAIDPAVFSDLRNTTGAEFVAELVDTFIEEGPGMLTELRDAHAKRDAERFRRAAHSLKSNGNTFGALKLAALARELELNGLDANWVNAGALLAVEAEYARAAAELKALRNA
jgi:HPt (histidine-containing phosphotransfer) domain-containing protein